LFADKVAEGSQEAEEAVSYDSILESYIATLELMGCNIAAEKRKIVVVLPKSDAYADMPENLKQFFNDDPIRQKLDGENPRLRLDIDEGMATYMEELQRASKSIREWFKTWQFGEQFLDRAKSKNIHLEFCMISAWGSPPDKENQTVPVRPIRVLDPLFWLLEFHSRKVG
jgi:hypothetical protein